MIYLLSAFVFGGTSDFRSPKVLSGPKKLTAGPITSPISKKARARTRPLELVAYSPPFTAIDTDHLPSDGTGLV